MIAFARAKAKSIFMQLRLNAISQKSIENDTKIQNEELSNEKTRSSTDFLEAIMRGGVWLS
tara:strand:+ start:555 stop:737 length:183 start_codon:yes stop_codon:yes gene_type:complete